MVRQVYKYWGDVLMFAGDALICLFEEKDDDEIFEANVEELLQLTTGIPFGFYESTGTNY